jgi:predicted ATPase
VRRYILTGTPGSGKTALLRHLETIGFGVVEEAATDVIALCQALGEPEPWRSPEFLDRILELQRKRQREAVTWHHDTVFFDRSPICTLALSRYASLSAPAALLAEVECVLAEQVYERDVFFVRHQGFVEPTAARRITLAESLVFERIHEDVYRELGYTLVDVPAGPLVIRAGLIEQTVRRTR